MMVGKEERVRRERVLHRLLTWVTREIFMTFNDMSTTRGITRFAVLDVLSLLVISRCRYLAGVGGGGGGDVRRQRSVLKVGPAQRTYENRQVCELGPGRGVSADLDHPEAGRRRSKEGQFHRH